MSSYSVGAVWKGRNGSKETVTVISQNDNGFLTVLSQIVTKRIDHWLEGEWDKSYLNQWFVFDEGSKAELPSRYLQGVKFYGGCKVGYSEVNNDTRIHDND